MKALILAAGAGKRLHPLTIQTPKTLLKVGERFIVDYILRAIRMTGIDHVVLVTGYMADAIRSYLRRGTRWKLRISYLHNRKFAETNNILSVKVAKKALGGHPFLLVNSDVLFAPSILAKMLNVDRHIVVAVDSGRTLMDEEMKVSVGPDGHVVAIGKWLDPSASHAEFMGVAKFSSEGAVRFFEAVEETIRDQGVQVFYERALNRLAQRGFPIYCADFKGYPWIEIDDYDDLNLARTVVINQILDSPG